MKAVPRKHYQQQQHELWRLLEVAGGSTHNSGLSIAEQLEAEFVEAWGFSGDIDGVSLEMKMMAARNCEGFDHCTCYYESETGSHVVVTQPYLWPGEAVELLRRGLIVGVRIRPEIIAAPEWAFYYPGHATLIVVKFPPGYESILKGIGCGRRPRGGP